MDNPSVLPPPFIQGDKPPFFPVSLLKLGVMSIVTLGLYQPYWMFQNWKLIKERKNTDIIPFWRAFFAIFWIIPLLREIHLTQKEMNPENDRLIPAELLGIIYIIVEISWRLPDPFWLVSLLAFVPLLVAQSYVNAINAEVAPNAPTNSGFTWANWIWIVCGGLLLILALIGALLPDSPQS
jgi:hypothetical protein